MTSRQLSRAQPYRAAIRLVRGMTAAGLLLLLMVGLPLALAHMAGWPLPRRLPTADELRIAANSPPDPRWLTGTLVCVTWLVWAWFTLVTVAETWAALTGRAVARARLGGGPVRLARSLVNAALLVSTTGMTLGPRMALAAPPAAVTASVTAPARPAGVEQAPAHPQDGRPVHVVRPNETLSDIAADRYGDWTKWRQLYALNRGRIQPDGRALDDPHELHPGDRILLLDDPAGPEDPPPGTAGSREVVVEPGDDMWNLSEAQLADTLGRPATDAEIVTYWRAVIAANRDRVADPNLIFSGQRLRLPPTTAPARPPQPAARPPGVPAERPTTPPAPSEAPERPGTPPAPTPTAVPSPAAPAAPPSRPATQRPAAEPDHTAPLPAPAVLGVAATGLAVAVSYSLARRRRQHTDRLPPGVRPAPPPAELNTLRGELVAADDQRHPDLLRAALAELATSLATRPGSPRPRLVQASAEQIEVLLSAPLLPATPGWQPSADGQVWTRELTGLSSDHTASGSAAPLLATIGAPEPSGQVYLDLEAEGVVSLTGDPDTCAGLVRSLVRELGHARYAGPLSIVLVGDLGDPSLAGVDRVRAVSTWPDVADHALALAEQSRTLLAARDAAHPFTARAHGDDDGLAPLLLVCATQPDDESFDRLCALVTAGNTTVTVLAVGGHVPAGATRIELDGTLLRIPSLGLTCRAQTISAQTSEQIATLLDHAEHAPPEPIPEPAPAIVPEPAATADDGQAGPTGGPAEPPEYDILVRLLGPIAVDGAAGPLTPQQTAVIAYIALHQPVAADTLEDAVWSQPTASRRRRRINTISECRAALGTQHFPVAAAGKYTLGPQVRTDLDLFDRHVARAAHQPAGQAIGALRAALDLVAGIVFTYRNADRGSYVWVDLEYWQANTETKITDAALRLAELCQQAGDTDGAVWAVQRGLLASPTHATLTETLMRVYDEAGDRGAAEHVYQSHRAALDDLDLDDVAESTAELHERIRRAARAGVSGAPT